MAPELKTKKRKASVPTGEAAVKKAKKTSADTEGAKKRKATNDIAAKPAKKSKAESSTPTIKAKPTTAKKQKSANTAAKKASPKKSTLKKTISTESVSVSDDESDAKLDEEAAQDSDDDDEEVDDQTVALLTGFDSEEEDPEPREGEGFKAGGDVGKIGKKAKKQALAAQKRTSNSDEPGTVYLGRIPHGFYEHEIKSYFSQFGEITRIRMSRNPKTGRSKHYAFVEFKSSEVAEIVAKTMDSYLLFGHILKCKLLAPGQVHKDLWKGANKRFKAVPWNKIAGRQLNQGTDEAGWEKRNEKEGRRRVEKAERLKAIGYEFEAPKLKSAKDVPKTNRQELSAAIANVIEAEADAEIEAIETALVPAAEHKAVEGPQVTSAELTATEVTSTTVTEENTKKSKKSKKGKGGSSKVVGTVETVQSLEMTEVVEEAPEVESSKGKKNKSKKTEKTTVAEKITVVEESVTEAPVAEEAVAPSVASKVESSKGKKNKSKKAKKTPVVEEAVIEAPVAAEAVAPSVPEKPKKAKKSKVVEKKVEESVVDTEDTANPTTSKKSKASAPTKTKGSEVAPGGKAKKVKKQKSSASLA